MRPGPRRNGGRYGKVVFSAGSVVALSLLLFLMGRNTERSPSLIGTLPNAPGVAGGRFVHPSVSPTETGAVIPDEGDSAISSVPLAQLVPTSEELRSEVEGNPENTPVSLILFSQEVRRRTVLAIRASSSDATEAMMSELESCVRAPGVAPQSQLVCVFNADRLLESDPRLAARAQGLRASLSPEARSVL